MSTSQDPQSPSYCQDWAIKRQIALDAREQASVMRAGKPVSFRLALGSFGKGK